MRALHAEIVDPSVAEHNGRIVKLMGDGVLIEFASVVDAVTCAVVIQQAMDKHNVGIPDDDRIVFRVGVNLGDIMVEGGDIYGDGVNVAARLEGLAEPGGICISRAAHDQVLDKLSLSFDDLGEQSFKNIARPVHAFQIRLAGNLSSAALDTGSKPTDKPSIAVLPFDNMSGDPEQEFFADGLTEDILTELSRFRGLFVISRNSAFVYKGRAVNIQDVARELGVQYVVEGSVRKAGNRVRVTVQLIDAETDRHVWAERYDRELEDIFAIQDDVSSAIVATLPGRVEAATYDRAERKPPSNMVAYEYVLAGKTLHHRSKKESNAEALSMLERAIALDSKYAHAHAWRACVLGQSWVHRWCADRDTTWNQIQEELRTALALDDNDSDVHRILAAVTLVRGDHEKASYHQERAIGLNPNDDLIVVQEGEILTWLGRPEEGIEWIRKAMRLNPYHPERFWGHLGRALFLARRYEEATDAFKRIVTSDQNNHAFLAACHAQADRPDEARAQAAQVLELQPDFTVAEYMESQTYKLESDSAHHRDALLKAGLPA